MNSDKDLVDVKMKMMMGIKVPMRDGVELTTDIYLPEDKLPCPIILQRSPYNSNVEASVKEAVYLVKEGYAFAYKKYSKKFVPDENYARLNNLGMWSMKFEYPWDWRKKN